MKIVYCYNTNSKIISIEAMMRAYQKEYNVFSWKPNICIAERQAGKWNIYYDVFSLQQCQKEVKRIFFDQNQLTCFFSCSEQIMNKMRQFTNLCSQTDSKLDTILCYSYIELYSEFLNYYSFSNEFCFKLVEQDILENNKWWLESKNARKFYGEMNCTYTYQVIEILNKFVEEYKKTNKINETKIDEFIEGYHFLFGGIDKGSIKKHILDTIMKEKLFPIGVQVADNLYEEDELLSKCSPECIEIVKNVLRLRIQRLVMREKMVRFNHVFMQLLTRHINNTYSYYFNDGDIEKLLSIISVDQLLNLEHLDVTMLHKARTNTLLFANQELLHVNRFCDYDLKDEERLQFSNSRISLMGQVVCGQGIIEGTIKTMLYDAQPDDEETNYIYVTKSLHPKDILLAKNIKAIIVDEGGILSHASIIAKELGIPCIINTKTASAYLKEMDRVSIDFDQGIVRLVEKNQDELNTHEDFVPLSASLQDKKLYGNKCVNLCTYFEVFNIVDGYVLSSRYVEKLYKQITFSNEFDMSSDIKKKVQNLFPIIMRSSSVIEDCEGSTAAGLLESIAAVDNFDDFAGAIITICDSSKTNSTNKYLELVGMENEKMPAVIIQKFLEFEILGVALVENDKATIEFRYKDTESYENYVIKLYGSCEQYKQSSNIIKMLIPELLKLDEKKGILVEFGMINNKLYILQVRKNGGKLDVYC